METYFLVVLLIRVVLPAGLLLSICLRPFGLSIIYLLLYLIAPLIKINETRSVNDCQGRFLVLNIVVSLILLGIHIAWHSTLAAFAPYGSLLIEYPIIEKIGLNLGLVSYEEIDPWMAAHFLAPEIVMVLVSFSVYIMTKKFWARSDGIASKKETKHQRYPLLTTAAKYFCVILIMFSGIMRPSVTSGIYFLVFLGVATAWSLGKPLQKGFAVVCRCLMAIMAVHVLGLLVYQCNWIMELYPPNMNMARYFGLTQLVKLNDTDASNFVYEVSEDHMWATLANPIVLLVTYFTLTIVTKELFKPKAKRKSALTGVEAGKLNGSMVRGVSFHHGSRRAVRDKWKSATKKVRVAFPYLSSKSLRGKSSENDPLIRNISPKRWSSTRSASISRHLHQDSTGSVIVTEDNDSLNEEPSLLDDILAAFIDFFQVLIRSSYIATTITMMAWSIMYHSWLTFVLLMWANIVWLCQDQRSFMLKTSPILVCYAMFLLLAQYIYGMNLTEDELPSEIPNVNLHQIGVGRSEGEPCVPLLIKSLFTCMFWVTLRQRVQEIRQRRRSEVITDMAAPLQLTLSTAATALESQREDSRSRLFRILGDGVHALCVRYWIYVVVIMLFVIGITGERMTMFRIIYMFLFLAFILMFQVSWYWWRRLMYVFWIVVIIYSMSNLILIYIYQFDNFSKMIEQYLFINEKLQHDLGLEPYDPADLFVKLLTPTLFLTMTIMQVHYFHKDFMAQSEFLKGSFPKEPDSMRPSQADASTTKDEVPQLPNEHDQPLSLETNATEANSVEMSSVTNPNHRRLSNSRRQRSNVPTLSEEDSAVVKKIAKDLCQKIKNITRQCIDIVFMYLDLHLIKIIFLSLMLLCTVNVCAMHVPIMLLISPGLWLSARQQRICVLMISTLISVYFMAKMIYQIDYIQHSFFDVNCTSESANGTILKTYNNAEWIGFQKITPKRPLVVLLKGYIGLIAVFTFYSLVTYRQQAMREKGLLPKENEKMMFPEITRKEADRDLIHCIKYLVNYGFYKFGVEITLICLMGVIGSRMDVYACVYAWWLLALVCAPRRLVARMWLPFTASVTVLVPAQYMISVGFLPQFCVQYPWAGDDQQIKHIRSWLFLPYPDEPPHAVKLIFDYFLLLFATRQHRVFLIEKTYGENYKGGSNSENIGNDWETPNFVNPVPDFLGNINSWLDVVKRMVFLGMLWVTLAIMFMTGTNRVNLFSMGYLIGSFIFLWQGTDFYLRPKDAILQWWSWLMRYNVGVVVVKALLQIPGCIFSGLMENHACWLVQLLGIGCVDKFAGGNIAKFLKMSYNKDSVCTVPQEDIGLAWDGVCFAFLILQRRLFYSFYFYRVIDESKATTILASRGAELIEELRQKQMKVQEEQEVRILEKIKIKMERIKANQKKIRGVVEKEPRHHDFEDGSDGSEDEEDRPGSEAPLERGESQEAGSARGFHTPSSGASPRGFHTPQSAGSPVRALVPPAPPSPSSALMTVSLDAYLEPRRISFESPPSSAARGAEDSYPVFSPPSVRRRVPSPPPSPSSRADPLSHHTWAEATACRRRRESSKRHEASYRPVVYREPASHQKAVRSGDYYMFEEFDDTDIQIKDEESSSDEDAPKEMGIGKLLSTVIKTDLKQAMRRASAPTVRPARLHSLSSHPLSYPHEARRRSSQTSLIRDDDIELMEREEQPMSDLEELDEEPKKESKLEKIKMYFTAVKVFISSLLVSATRHLMKYSRDYRYVSRTLFMEKKKLKEKEGFGIGIREGSQMIWEPLPETLAPRRKLSDISVPEIRILAPSMERGLDASPPPRRRTPSPSPAPRLHLDSYAPDDDDTSEHESAFSLQSTSSKDVTTLEEHDDSLFNQQKSPLLHVLLALWFALLAHTDILCYIMVFINQIQSATILSIPLPLMVFLWGTLTIPRPTKTFWVTIIAYTEVIVLIKSMFQFEILPWNQKVIPANMPFTAPRIIGIERKYNYALYDLLLLLVIFAHRFMLKSLGLWKESSPEIELREDKEYPLTVEDTKMIVEGQAEEVGRKYVKLHDKIGPDEAEEDLSTEMHNESRHENRESDGAGPSKPPDDDDHYKVDDDKEPIIAVTTTMEDTYGYFPNIMLLSVKRYLRPMQVFFKRMLEPGARVTADVYAYMFLCDFFNFLVVIFGFAAFGTHQGDGGVQAYLEENKVPIPFLIMLILQFALIIIDRALYLRKFMLGKILFQYALIIGVHIWMFFVLPFITERTFNSLLPPPMWYMMKCIYLLLSAYQIRCGYPRRIIGNFLCKSYSFINMVCFRGFMAVPFVFELRTLMDWIWTDTSMTLMDWLKMEDIFASVYLLKCSRNVEDEYPQPRGVKKSNTSKYLLGGGVLAFVIAIIWFPLVFFAFGNTVGQPNPPTDVTVKIRIGPFLPVYQMSAQSHNIDVFSEQDFAQLSNMYARDRSAQTFLSNYMYNDVAVITINPNSTMRWEISPPELKRLQKEAMSNASLSVKFNYVITHPSNAVPNPPVIEDNREVTLLAGQHDRDTLIAMLDGTAPLDAWINVKTLFPKFVKVFNKGSTKPAHQLMPVMDETIPSHDPRRLYRDVQLRLERDNGVMYWRVREGCAMHDPLKAIPLNDCNMLIMYTFNDKLFPETLNFISGSGIIGLYTTFVFLASRVLRGFFSGIYTKIMFDDLPNVDRVLQLCLDIYLVREALELRLEEDLFAKLVFLYRSPETMIKWSRPKEEENEQRALPPSR